ncbi:hypothetical protein CPB84DRAFT_1784425 [Gymnopilus junonius]|uniref:Uncharacterized protein n=1 Tax=Gymnopilus junonius TaxID=109634 RepID=A0A9P5NKM1_GYMJU|nr:hypothetical protein CPB84DRAFT_1784425 [Gymnopilus junonius]
MAQDLGAILISLEIVLFSILSIPLATLSALLFSWLTHLPHTVRQEVEKDLGGGAGLLVVLFVGMLGSFLWLVMILCIGFRVNCLLRPPVTNVILLFPFRYILLSSRYNQVLTAKVVGVLGFLSVIMWVAYLVATPWHPESKLSPEILAVQTVRKGCREILALKCLILVNLSLLALFILTCIGENRRLSGPGNASSARGQRTAVIAPNNIMALEDGAAGQPAHSREVAGKGNLGGAVDRNVSHPESEETQEKPTTEAINMAAMDGAG